MALPATHLRFALDIARNINIEDRNAYLSGTLYPDSRWITGVARAATHGDRCLNNGFADNAFLFGWRVHCHCDRLQRDLLLSRCPGMGRSDGQILWMNLTVAKTVQDQEDIMHIPIEDCLRRLDVIRSPNGEQPGDVGRYFDIIRKAYARSPRPDMEDYRRLWLAVGIDASTVSELLLELKRKMKDDTYLLTLRTIYREMISAFDPCCRPPKYRV